MKKILLRLRDRFSSNRNNYRFGHFRFDARLAQLSAGSEPVALRPKTASVLKVLLLANGGIVAKSELIAKVWCSNHVQHQSLFQAMSELRRQLAPLQPIKTHPNLGYQWVGVERQPRRRAAAIAVSFALLAALAGSLVLTTALHGTGPVALASSQSPAMRAFGAGLKLLDQSRPRDAQSYFELAVRENPQYLEATLMLSEALLAQGHLDEARTRAQQLMQNSRQRGDTYTQVAALSLLSRTDQELGRYDAALRWALSAADTARSAGFACTAQELTDRIAVLANTRITADDAGQARSAHMSPWPATTSAARLADLPAPDYCDDLEPVTQHRGGGNGHPNDTPAPRHLVCSNWQPPRVARV